MPMFGITPSLAAGLAGGLSAAGGLTSAAGIASMASGVAGAAGSATKMAMGGGGEQIKRAPAPGQDGEDPMAQGMGGMGGQEQGQNPIQGLPGMDFDTIGKMTRL